ncbi:MAG: pyruvate dehydrogenase (acetyl-transferring), homodimeric type, partial [Myxococcales bacterium]
RTFGMEGLFRQAGIYSHVGQLYEPVDAKSLLYYREAIDGQILEEGITEAGAMSSFIAAGTAYATHGIDTIPFFLFYSMFGFQRVGDLIWAAADMRCKGFLVGGTAGRTTLAGEGLQHQDGHSQHLAQVVPTLRAYDPAFAYEIAAIIQDGLKRMYEDREDTFYYLTVENENILMPAMPEGVRDGILRGLYRFKAAEKRAANHVVLLGSGAILGEVLKAKDLLAERYGVSADVWSVTSYSELRRDAISVERWNVLHPAEPAREPYVTSCLGTEGVVVAASDYLKSLPDSVARWCPGAFVSLGTDGFGRSDSREALRAFFEVDARFISLAALSALAREGRIDAVRVAAAARDLGIDPEKVDPRDV